MLFQSPICNTFRSTKCIMGFVVRFWKNWHWKWSAQNYAYTALRNFFLSFDERIILPTLSYLWACCDRWGGWNFQLIFFEFHGKRFKFSEFLGLKSKKLFFSRKNWKKLKNFSITFTTIWLGNRDRCKQKIQSFPRFIIYNMLGFKWRPHLSLWAWSYLPLITICIFKKIAWNFYQTAFFNQKKVQTHQDYS